MTSAESFMAESQKLIAILALLKSERYGTDDEFTAAVDHAHRQVVQRMTELSDVRG